VDIVKSKTCSICKIDKLLSLFNKRGGKEVGYRSFCKECQSNKDAARYDSDKRKSKYLSNHLKEKELRREYYRRTKEAYFIRKAKRRSQTLEATPKWYGEFDEFVLSEAYRLCKLREKATGIKWEVDHIVPLQGKIVCGLHWYQNWSVKTQFENRAKGNKYDY
jgi:hypothetical protein